MKFSSLYVGPMSGDKVPVVIWLHGGPQSVFAVRFMPEVLYFLRLGYAVQAINYRGGLGFGQNNVQSLLGHIGSNDVGDCVTAVRDCLAAFPHLDADGLFLFGGSHGGFLVTNLAGQHPDMFAAVVCRNPVTDLVTMSQVSDIPDWISNESGLSYDPDAYFGPTLPKSVRSPSEFVDNIKTPIYFMIGTQDLRVPPQQGIEMYKKLKASGKPVKLNTYEDNHPLAKVPVHSDVMINTAIFFEENKK